MTDILVSTDVDELLRSADFDEIRDLLGVSIFNIILAASDEVSDLVVGDNKAVFRTPFAGQISSVKASVGVAPVGSHITVDIEKNGVSILTTLIRIDANHKTSTTSSIQPVINLANSSFLEDDEISINLNSVGSTDPGAGLKVTIVGTY
jgi:hypothetical protein